MGTEILLDVGGLIVDWCKNSRGTDHGMLFQAKDRKRIRSKQIDYEYFQEVDEEPASMEMAFSRPLKEMIPRLELLGFTLDRVRHEYSNCVEGWREECLNIADEEEKPAPEPLSFDEFCSFIKGHPIEDLDDMFVSSFDPGDGKKVQGRFGDMALIEHVPYAFQADANAYSERSYFGGLISFLHPYSLLRVLAECAANLCADVVWQYGPLVDAGWASESDFTPKARCTYS